MDDLKFTTPLGENIRREKVLWILHRGNGRASLGKPESLQESIDVGSDTDVVRGVPIEDVLTGVCRFLREHSGWCAV